MRGKRYLSPPSDFGFGITPADAGKTDNRSLGTNRRLGSPPRMRGKLGDVTSNFIFSRITPADAGKTCFAFVFFCVLGITPADAGKTDYNVAFFVQSRDHPRGCGENYLAAFQAVREQGSPPQVRGKLSASAYHAAAAGITPAGAGKTCEVAVSACCIVGSPPQVRGKHRYPRLVY